MTSRSSKWLRRIAGSLATLLFLPFLACGALHVVARCGSYPVEDLEHDHGSTRIYDASGHLLREATGGGARSEWAPLAQISPLVVSATIAVEDHRFRGHSGVDWSSVARATGQLFTSGHVVSGASTITMQVVRLVHPHDRNVPGKLGEMIDALRLERAVDKDTILEQYLNRSPFGANTIGIEAASRRYFGKPSMHLSLAEAALLAGLPQAPARLDPLSHRDAAVARQHVVLDRMLSAGSINDDEYRRALAEPLQLAAAPPPPKAMHFTDWVLAKRHGDRIDTTLDGDLQTDVEAMVREHVHELELSGVSDAAVVVLDNAQCHVLAMVGSPDYRDPRGGAVNATLARRSPGSTLKPFAYALAFEHGDTPASVVADVEARYGTANGFLWAPQNYSQTFSGPVFMSEALARSLNVPAMRVAERVGIDKLLDRLHALGFVSLDRPASHYGLGLALGDGEVTLVELAQAYAALARGGMTCAATPFPLGTHPLEQRAFSATDAWLVTDILSDETIRAAAFGPSNALMLGYPVAIKTGTSSNWRDSWTVGYTPRFTVAVWAGDYTGRSMNRLAGAAGAGPLFRRVMNRLTERTPPTPQPRPADIAEVEVCAVSGQLATPHCSHTRSIRVQRDHLPTETCTWHRDIAIDTRNGLRAGDRCPARFVERRTYETLPPQYSKWLSDTPERARPPADYSPLCPQTGTIKNALVVTYPRAGEAFLVEPGYDAKTQTLAFTAEIDPPVAHPTWVVDGERLASDSWQLRRGKHQVIVEAAGQRSDPIDFEVR
jgi:penicillin-binding protein 1C